MNSLRISSNNNTNTNSLDIPEHIQNMFVKGNDQLHVDFVSDSGTISMTHFENNKRAIKEATADLHAGIAVVLGVGYGHDIPIKELTEKFDELYLVDITFSKVQKEYLIHQIPKKMMNKVHFCLADLTGIWHSFPKLIEELEKKKLSCVNFNQGIIHGFSGIDRKKMTFLGEKKASFVVSSLISSQLNSCLVRYVKMAHQKLYPGVTIDGNDDTTQNVLENFLDIELRHMRDLKALVSHTGKIYYSDTYRMKLRDQKILLSGQTLPPTNISGTLPMDSKVKEWAEEFFSLKKESSWGWIQITTVYGMIDIKNPSDQSVISVPFRNIQDKEWTVRAFTFTRK